MLALMYPTIDRRRIGRSLIQGCGCPLQGNVSFGSVHASGVADARHDILRLIARLCSAVILLPWTPTWDTQVTRHEP
eukprot:3486961-Amphidinium_carterae.1